MADTLDPKTLEQMRQTARILGPELRGVKDKLVELEKPTRELQPRFAALSDGLRRTAGSVLAAGTAMAGLSAGLIAAVQAAAPGTVARLQLAFADLAAVFGHMLRPAVERLTEKVREFADWILNMDEGTKQTITTLGKLVLALAAARVALVAFHTAAAVLGPILTAVGAAVGTLGIVSAATAGKLGLAAVALAGVGFAAHRMGEDFANVTKRLFEAHQELLREGKDTSPSAVHQRAKENFEREQRERRFVEEAEEKKKLSAFGLAARPAQFAAIEEIGRQATLGALQSGGALDPAKATADNTGRIWEMLNQGGKVLGVGMMEMIRLLNLAADPNRARAGIEGR